MGDKNKILIVLDRDGTLNYDPGWFGRDPDWRNQLKLLPGVAEGIKRLNSLGRVMVASNQYGVARGFFSLETVLSINRELDILLRKQGAIVENWQICPFVDYDWAVQQNLDLSTPWVIKGDTPLRKPSGGMIRKAAEEMGLDYKGCKIYSIGNRELDAEIGVRAGGKGVIVFDSAYEKEYARVRELSEKNDKYVYVSNFLEAVKFIEDDFE